MHQALQFLGREYPSGLMKEHGKAWKEYFCLKNQRYYYCCDPIGRYG